MPPPLIAPDLSDASARLRELRDDDVPAFARALRDPGVSDLAYSGALAPDEAVVAAYVRRMREQAAAGERILLAVVDERDAMVGLTMLFHLDERNRDAEIGFWLAPEARGRGVATAAIRLVAGWGMRELAVERVYAMTNPANHGAQAALERAGFRLDGTIRGRDRTASGERRDSLSYTLLVTDERAPA